MAAEAGDQNALTYVQETVLKKRKNNEEWAIKRRSKLESRRQKKQNDSKALIRKPEDFVKDYRERELDFIRMKNRTKIRKINDKIPESTLLFVIRLHNTCKMHPSTRKLLDRLRLKHIFSGVFLRASKTIMGMLLRVEPFVTYGYPNLKSVRELIFKKGCIRVRKERIPLTDNIVVEKALGKHGVICIEDIVHQIANVGPHFHEVSTFLMPLRLKKPAGDVLLNNRRLFKDGGDAGNREDLINDLIIKMN